MCAAQSVTALFKELQIIHGKRCCTMGVVVLLEKGVMELQDV